MFAARCTFPVLQLGKIGDQHAFLNLMNSMDFMDGIFISAGSFHCSGACIQLGTCQVKQHGPVMLETSIQVTVVLKPSRLACLVSC